MIVVDTASGTPMLPSMKRRTVGPSFKRKSVLKTVKVRKKISDVSPWIPCASPVSSVVPASATPLFASSVALEVSSAPASLTHPSTRSTRVGHSRFDLRRLLGDAAEDEQEDDHSERDQRQEHENGTADSRYSVLLQLRDDGPGDGCEDGAHHHRLRDRRCEPEQPDGPEEDEADPDQEPGEQPQVA